MDNWRPCHCQVEKMKFDLNKAWALRGRKRRDAMAVLAEVHLAVLIGLASAVARNTCRVENE